MKVEAKIKVKRIYRRKKRALGNVIMPMLCDSRMTRPMDVWVIIIETAEAEMKQDELANKVGIGIARQALMMLVLDGEIIQAVKIAADEAIHGVTKAITLMPVHLKILLKDFATIADVIMTISNASIAMNLGMDGDAAPREASNRIRSKIEGITTTPQAALRRHLHS
ncbi:MAG: hypothetical protein Q9191_006584 [Dirinaria sp. TL-2023a]